MKKNPFPTDRLEEAGKYHKLHSAFEKAFAFLSRKDLAHLPVGRHEIEGDRIFCLISRGPGRSRADAKLEVHRRYIDIQYIIAGTDEMGWKSADACAIPEAEFNADKDIGFFNDEPMHWTRISAGSFAVFFPKDAHAPLVSGHEIHKAVVKIAVRYPERV